MSINRKYRSPNHGGPMKKVKYIMLHATASTNTMGSVSWLCNKKSGVSAHFVVSPDGKIYQLVKMGIKAYHAGKGYLAGKIPLNDGNSYCIGIEIVNKNDGKDRFEKKQLVALNNLIKHIRKTYPKAKIIDHKEYAGKRKSDMPKNFEKFLKNYKKYGTYYAPKIDSKAS